MNGIKSSIITNLSIGTLVIVGLHYPIVSLVNFGLEHLLKIDSICYQWYEALLLALGISALLYIVILYGKKHAPILLGKSKTIKINKKVIYQAYLWNILNVSANIFTTYIQWS